MTLTTILLFIIALPTLAAVVTTILGLLAVAVLALLALCLGPDGKGTGDD